MVEGSPITVALRGGDSAIVLLHVARRFFYEIDSELRTEDISGHTTDRAVATAYESNSLSGTAQSHRRVPVSFMGRRGGGMPGVPSGCRFPALYAQRLDPCLR